MTKRSLPMRVRFDIRHMQRLLARRPRHIDAEVNVDGESSSHTPAAEVGSHSLTTLKRAKMAARGISAMLNANSLIHFEFSVGRTLVVEAEFAPCCHLNQLDLDVSQVTSPCSIASIAPTRSCIVRLPDATCLCDDRSFQTARPHLR